VSRFACCDELRRVAIVGHATLNAIDYLEVADLSPAELDPAQAAEYVALPPDRRGRLLWQRRLTIRFVNPLTVEQQAGLSSDHIVIGGGERVRGITVEVLQTTASAVTVRASVAGDHSHYTLAFVRSATDDRPPEGFDPVSSEVGFSFKVDCPSDFDCRTDDECDGPETPAPRIDYLAKDYGSFRRLILDRMALLTPDWRERNPADLGIALVELLAYVGDHLSYRQDAVATEAYLETARRRTSVRRHALLVDYALDEGRNARAWLHLEVNADVPTDPDMVFFTGVPRLDPRVTPGSTDHQTAIDAHPEWFAPVGPLPPTLAVDLNRLSFYTWGDDRCCLPAGATRATLRGHHPGLRVGDVLVFEEVKGPLTGAEEDADPTKRHAVRLTGIVVDDDGGAPLTDPLDGTEITEIEWHGADALPFGLCVSARTEDDDKPVHDVSVATGNILLVDHGLAQSEDLGAVPEPQLEYARPGAAGCDREPRLSVPPRFRPTLGQAPLTWTATVERAEGDTVTRVPVDERAPAAAAFPDDPRGSRPAVELDSLFDGDHLAWQAAADLLQARADTAEFVVEAEQTGTATLRFGDGTQGRAPRPGESFTAGYRVGNGVAGNVGADAIVHAVTADGRIDAVRNPLPARGGAEPETVAQARRRAPQAFRRQERAVTTADYEEVTTRHPGLQRAAATLRWTGSWSTVFLAVDRIDGDPLDAATEAELVRHVDRYRMAGHDLELDDPRYVPLEIGLFVCVAADYFRSDVRQRLLDVLSSHDLGRGRRGLFHPDNFTFGQTVYLSPVLAAAHDVPGVASATITTFQRQGIPAPRYIDDGKLPLGRLEIPQLDNDPNFPEHGVLTIEMGGGK
jgi:hypothetical protein